MGPVRGSSKEASHSAGAWPLPRPWAKHTQVYLSCQSTVSEAGGVKAVKRRGILVISTDDACDIIISAPLSPQGPGPKGAGGTPQGKGFVNTH